MKGHLGSWFKYKLTLSRLAKEAHIVTKHSCLHNHKGKWQEPSILYNVL